MSEVGSENFSEILMSELRAYTGTKCQKIEIATEKISKKHFKAVKAKSPKLTGDYSKGWKRTIIKNTSKSGVSIYIHQKGTGARLTHLLEDGHETRKPGKRTKPIPHIYTVNAEANKELSDAIDKILKE